MPIGVNDIHEMTDEELDEIWKKYGKLKRGSYKRMINLRRN